MGDDHFVIFLLVADLVEQVSVLDRCTHVGGDGAQQAHIILTEAPLSLGALHADHANGLPANHDRHAKVGERPYANLDGPQRLAAAFHVLID